MLLELLDRGRVRVSVLVGGCQYGLLSPLLHKLAAILDPGHIAFPTIRHEQFTAHVVLFCFMLMAFWIDVDEMTIPDGVTIPGTLAGLLILTLWPFAFLPDSFEVPSGFLAEPMLTSVWLTSPDEVPRCRTIRRPCLGMCHRGSGRHARAGPALAGAVAAFCAWCLALLPGAGTRGTAIARAVRVFTARMVRERTTYALLALAVLGSIVIAIDLVDRRTALDRAGKQPGRHRDWRGTGLDRPHCGVCHLAP